ncbi:polysaccharide deacetylase family protein [Solidesulfovibrio sp.]|uniref:polysaccharide deacetylase family protein n=1 Tax=Solidesulfovibrio sp. TaxID=2910990 RepID=UPI002613BBC4|nr:polysaccharide deacetylase family protein [Solidesulfovibrio sp.]
MDVKSLTEALAWRLELFWDRLERLRTALVVVNYHRLYARAPDTPFDPTVYGGISLDYFRRQLRWLRDNARILSEEELLDCLARRRAFPRRAVALTFDDGYRDNYDLAFPALRERGMPAFFFIPTGPLLDRRLGWWDIVAYLVRRSPVPVLELEGVRHRLDGPSARQACINILQERYKTLPEAKTRHLTASLAEKLETAFPPAALQDAELMTVEHLREMTGAGMAVGAHTHSHRVLATLAPQEQRRELVEGKRLLEEQLGRPVRSLAYPVGRRDSFGEETKRMAREAGYSMAFSLYSGCNRPGSLDPMDIRRSAKRRPFDAFTASILYPGRVLRAAR